MLVVDADNKADYREVTLGASVDGLRVVTSGLKAGERIVVNGLQRVRPGALVEPQTGSDGPALATRSQTATSTSHSADRCTQCGAGRHEHFQFFIDRPIFAGVLSVLIFLAGLLALRVDADLGISGSRAAVGRGARAIIRAPIRR